MRRSLIAVLVGWLIFGVSAALWFAAARRNPHEAAPWRFMLTSTLWGMTNAFVAGYVAAMIGRRSPRRHAYAVAAIIALGAAVSAVAGPAGSARWSQLAALFILAPCAAVGGISREREVARRAAANKAKQAPDPTTTSG
jgi:MFS family permease